MSLVADGPYFNRYYAHDTTDLLALDFHAAPGNPASVTDQYTFFHTAAVDYTVSAFVNMSSATTPLDGIADVVVYASGAWELAVDPATLKVTFSVWDTSLGGGTWKSASTAANVIRMNEWHNLRAVYAHTPGTVDIYVDDRLVSSQLPVGAMLPTPGYHYVTISHPWGSSTWHGRITGVWAIQKQVPTSADDKARLLMAFEMDGPQGPEASGPDHTWNLLAYNYNLTGTVTANGTTVTGVSSTAGLHAGEPIGGPGIAPWTTIASLGTNFVTLSHPAVASGANVALSGLISKPSSSSPRLNFYYGAVEGSPVIDPFQCLGDTAHPICDTTGWIEDLSR